MRWTAGLRGRAGRFIVGEEGRREGGRGEREEVEGYEEEFVKGADCEKHVLFGQKVQQVTSKGDSRLCCRVDVYLVRIVKMEQLRPILVDLFVTHPLPRHRQRSIHMHVMASQIQTDEPLKQ